ncbi:PKS-ER domain-containing protein [Aphelenchoides fujianensis]|nr:PKS-ER domain-containing protein [Aphelenchoides fujianensis]
MPTIRCRCVRFHSYGDPTKVTQLECTDVDTTLKPTEVSDRRSNRCELGDHVICLDTAQGIWIEYQAVEEQNLYKFDKRVDLLTAATFCANPPTAWMMLKNYVNLVAGDFVIQNAANSGVGRAVIEIAKAWGLRTINIVRERPDIADLKAELRALGADHVFTEEEFKRDGRKFVAQLDRPLLLALNGVGGRSALGLAASLSYGGTMVTYGGMSKQPHQITTSALVFNGINVRGVAMGFTLMQSKNAELRTKIFDELQVRSFLPSLNSASKGKLHGQKADIHPMKDFKTALKQAMAGKHRKQVILLSPPGAASRL